MERITNPPAVFVISGGAGALGKHVARVALAQFCANIPPIIVIPQVRTLEQLMGAVERVAAANGVIVHTMVDPELHAALGDLVRARGLTAIDTIGDSLAQLADHFGRQPAGQPGLFQRQQEVYLERIQAIEYTVDHDDGRNLQDLDQADVILTGVSRVGKTPLSIYLSVLGWKVANVPLARELPPPPELFRVDRRRVVGLTIDIDILAQHRHWRQLGSTMLHGYTAPDVLEDEILAARRVFRQGGFAVVNVTNKPIEETADQVIALISRWFEHRVAS
jgi:[pyruvate, water dikinase]-phosphate phosphotransferase / [pyruvate, water dikinase] kinase